MSSTRGWLLGLLVLSTMLCLGRPAWQRSRLYKDHLYVQLLSGSTENQLRAASLLVYLRAEEQLLRTLKSDNDSVRNLGQRALEHLWLTVAGDEACAQLLRAHGMARSNALEALQQLDSLLEHYPSFAEGWNQRAAVHWQLGQYEASMADSIQALKLNPHHYGAWQGLGVGCAKQGQNARAAACFRAALQILPYDPATHEALRRCEQLREISPAIPGTNRQMVFHRVTLP